MDMSTGMAELVRLDEYTALLLSCFLGILGVLKGVLFTNKDRLDFLRFGGNLAYSIVFAVMRANMLLAAQVDGILFQRMEVITCRTPHTALHLAFLRAV